MNIQQYYEKTASVSLNASLASLVPPFFLVMYGIITAPDGRMGVIVIPFLLYSFICYQYYLVNDKRSKAIAEIQKGIEISHTSLMKEDTMLIHFLPAPSLRMLFFGWEGQLLGEIRDINLLAIRWFMPYFLDKLIERKYGLYDESNRLVAIYRLKNNRIELMDVDKEMKSLIIQKPNQNKSEIIFERNGNEIKIERSLIYMDYQFYNQNTKIGRLQKGWMPLKWGNKFKDPNTPILSFEKTITDEQKITLFAILAKLFHYRNH